MNAPFSMIQHGSGELLNRSRKRCSLWRSSSARSCSCCAIRDRCRPSSNWASAVQNAGSSASLAANARASVTCNDSTPWREVPAARGKFRWAPPWAGASAAASTAPATPGSCTSACARRGPIASSGQNAAAASRPRSRPARGITPPSSLSVMHTPCGHPASSKVCRPYCGASIWRIPGVRTRGAQGGLFDAAQARGTLGRRGAASSGMSPAHARAAAACWPARGRRGRSAPAPPGTAASGSHAVHFDVEALGRNAAQVSEKTVFLVPR